MVLWPPFQGEHGVSPPSVSLSEGKNVGTSDHPDWKDTYIRLTLDKLPRIIQDLQVAYAMAMAVILEEESSTPTPATAPAPTPVPVSTPVRPQAPPTLAGRILKLVSEEHRVSGDVVTLASQFNTTQDAVSEAIQQLQGEGFIKIEMDGLKPFLVRGK